MRYPKPKRAKSIATSGDAAATAKRATAAAQIQKIIIGHPILCTMTDCADTFVLPHFGHAIVEYAIVFAESVGSEVWIIESQYSHIRAPSGIFILQDGHSIVVGEAVGSGVLSID
jgi:hypothetical protein